MAGDLVVEIDPLPDGIDEEEFERKVAGWLGEILNRHADSLRDTEEEPRPRVSDMEIKCVVSLDAIEYMEIVVTEHGTGAQTHLTLTSDGDLVETTPPPDLQQ